MLHRKVNSVKSGASVECITLTLKTSLEGKKVLDRKCLHIDINIISHKDLSLFII
uniref:Uncharacterized protein n=1 Tax=Amphimedon queenslandica TaxID=400682 RepID=A0A1X7UCW3_AMPQE